MEGDGYSSGPLTATHHGHHHEQRYYEPPLSAGAMLSLGGQAAQQAQDATVGGNGSPTGAGQSFVYEYYKLPDPKDMDQHATVYMR